MQPAAGDRAEPDHARAEDDTGRSRLDLRSVHRRAKPGRKPAREQRAAVERRLAVDVRERHLGDDRVVREGRAAHEVTNRFAVTRQPGGAVGQVALVLLLADADADVGLAALAVDALVALRLEQGDHVVPSATDVTSSPTFSTTPAPSWPSTHGE